MSEKQYPITYVHEDTKEKLVAANEVQAHAFEKAGWKEEKKK